MFDAQTLLGHVLRDALGGGLGGGRRRNRRGSLTGLPRGLEGKIGMGLIGLAVAAFEHFHQQQSAPAASGPATPPMPPPPPPADDTGNAQSLHVLRAMIAAANADGLIDAQEREGIVGRARDAGMAPDQVAALDAEFRAPLPLDRLIAQTPDDLREEVYVAALIGMNADTDAEHRFLEQLTTGLRLDASAQRRIHEQLGLTEKS